jgi:hypothetical protein
MADLKEWYNADGLKVRFAGYQGQKRTRKNTFVEVKTSGNYREAICHYDLTLIPTTTISYTTDRTNNGVVDGFNSGDFYIPANSTVLSCDMFAFVTAVGGTAVEVGGYKEDGTVIDRDGLITAANGVIADMAASERIIGTGADLADATGENGVGVDNYYIGIYSDGTFTAGTGKIVVRWVDPAA